MQIHMAGLLPSTRRRATFLAFRLVSWLAGRRLALPFPGTQPRWSVQWSLQEGSPLTVAGAATDSGPRIGSSPTVFRLSPLPRTSSVGKDRTSFLARQTPHNKRIRDLEAPDQHQIAAAARGDFFASVENMTTKGLANPHGVCYTPPTDAVLKSAATVIPGSSVVEQAAVNRLVAGSNPARGATALFFPHIANVPPPISAERRVMPPASTPAGER